MKSSPILQSTLFSLPKPFTRLVVGCVTALVFFAGYAAFATPESQSPIAGFNGESFAYQISEQERQGEYTLYRITYPSPDPREMIDSQGVAYYYRPNNLSADAPRPGVVCLHILGGDGSLTRTIASYLASQGIPSMMVIMPWFGERAPNGGRGGMNSRALIGALQQTPGDVRRAIDIFSRLPGVDSQKLGLVGTSMGALFGATVSGMDERIQKATFLLGGGGLKFILEQPTPEAAGFRNALNNATDAEKKEFDQILGMIDPLTHADKLRERAKNGKIVMMNAENDTVIPPAAAQQLADAMELPKEQLIWLPDVDHYSALSQLPNMLTRLRDFFSDETVVPVPPVAKATIESVIFNQLANLFDLLPGTFVELEIDGVLANNKECKGTISLRRGNDDRFKVDVKLKAAPIPIKEMTIGRDDKGILWLSGNENLVFYGSEQIADTQPAASFPALDPQVLQYQAFLSGIFRLAAANPNLLKQFAQVQKQFDKNQQEYLAVDINKAKIHLQIYPDPQYTRPGKLEAQAKEFSGTISVTSWDLKSDTAGNAFSPTSGAKIIKVNAYDLNRMLTQAVPFLTKL